jgi:hypothetical protein
VALEVDDLAETTVPGLRLREAPGTGAASLGTLAAGAVSIVVDGPMRANGHEWYLLSGLGLPYASGCATGPGSMDPWTCPVWLGWVAAASIDGDPWLHRTEPRCADPAGPLSDFTFQQRYAYIVCYGNEPVSLRGWLVVHVGAPVEDPCPEVPQDVRWLGCAGMFELVDSPDSSGPGLVMTLGPEAGLPDDAVQIEVTGHYDDPSARDCTYGDEPERSILDCRSQFVVDSGPVSGN